MHQRKDWFYPTAFSDWGDAEEAAIDGVIKSGRFTMGEQVEAFEAEFARFHKMKYGIMVNSGSSANLIMVAALCTKSLLHRHNKVLVPAIAWSTTYAPLLQYGLIPKVVDCDNSWNFNPVETDVADCRAAIGVSILGVGAHNSFLKNAIQGAGGIFLEDNCESLGAHEWLGGPLCGTQGLMNSFSFFYSHQISAIEGGMILTNDPVCARQCRILRAHGWTRDVSPPTSFEQEYNFTDFGYNVRPLELHAAVARVQLSRLPRFIQHRRTNLELFYNLTNGLPIQHQHIYSVEASSPFGLVFTVGSLEVRRKLVAALRAKGVDCRLPTGGSFYRHPYSARSGLINRSMPVADRVHDCGMFLGNAPFPIGEQIETAVMVMREVLE